MDEIRNDKRFSHILTNPKYFKMGRKDKKFRIDARFKEMFKDKNFKIKYTVDSRGRPWKSSTNEDLKRFYELSSSEESDEVEENKKTKNKNLKKSFSEQEILIDESKSSNKNDLNIIKKIKKKVNGENITNDNQMVSKKDVKNSLKFKNANNIAREHQVTPSLNKSLNDSSIKNSCRDKNLSSIKNIEVNAKLNSSNSHKKCKSNRESNNIGIKQAYNKEEAVNLKDDVSSEGYSSDDEDYSDDDNKSDILNCDDDDGDDDNDDDDDDDSSEEETDENRDIVHAWGELDRDAPRTETITSRLALCNMNWDRIKADDILVMLNSFKSETSAIKSVKIYLSEYGKERLEYEKLKGPLELTQKLSKNINNSATENEVVDVEDDDSDNDNFDESSKLKLEGSKYSREKLRQYELSRLKYYYAIIECDAASTADRIYENCNGIEFESSANQIDLRFVPEDMVFEEEPVSISTNLPCQGTYKPSIYTNTALHQSNVELTWDETPADRVAVTMRDFSKVDFENMDVNDYLASASEDENCEMDDNSYDDDNGDGSLKLVSMDDQIKKYKDLLRDIDTNGKSEDEEPHMEITWEPGLKETVEQKLEEKKSSELTPWEKYLDKKSKKKKLKKDRNANVDQKQDNTMDKKKGKPKRNVISEHEQAELELLVMDGKVKTKNNDIKKKNKRNKMDNSFKMTKEVDERFKEISSDPRFVIDPSSNEYQKIKKIQI